MTRTIVIPSPVLRHTGITHENIVQEAKKFLNSAALLQGAQVSPHEGLRSVCLSISPVNICRWYFFFFLSHVIAEM